jgi:type IV pilus assembly protein PilN
MTIKINLLPKDIKIKEDRPELILLALLVVVFVFGIMVSSYVEKLIERKNLRNDISIVDKELTYLQGVINKISQIKAQREALNAKKSAMETLVKSRLVYPIMMEDLVKTLPEGVWLLNLTTRSGEGKTSLRFDACAWNNYIVSDLLKALESSTIFQNPEITGINTVSGEKGTQIKQFTITVDYINQEWK